MYKKWWHLITAAGKPQLISTTQVILILISRNDNCGHQLMISKCVFGAPEM